MIQHYVDIDKVAYKKKYEEGFNKLSSDEEPTHEEEDNTPQPKKKDTDDTSRYIALFRDGLIGKEEFFKLTTNTNNNQNEPSPIYQ